MLFRAALCWLVLCATAAAQITLPDETPPHTPIIAGCNCVIPEGAEIRIVWRGDDDCSVIPVGNQAHIWAPPGNHELSMTLVWMQFDEVEVNGKKLRVLLAWDMQAYSRQFTVTGPEPEPDPGPPNPPGPKPPTPPTPGDFAAQVRAAINLVPATARGHAATIATNYEAVAAEAAANPGAWDVATLVNEVKVRHTTTLTTEAIGSWTPFWPALGKAQKAKGLASTDLPGHIAMFHEIASVLREVKTTDRPIRRAGR